jgi:hypothetical protein
MPSYQETSLIKSLLPLWSKSQQSNHTIAYETIKLVGNKSEIIEITFQKTKI